jgi:hypothetical protein
MAKKNSITNKVRNGLRIKSDLEKLEDRVINFGTSRVGITKKNHLRSKKSIKISEKSKKINRNKVRHHYTNKEKKTR